MGVLDRAQAHLRRQRALAKRAATEVVKLWGRVDRKAIALSWGQSLPAALSVVESAQAIAAASAGPYLDDLLEDYGLADGSVGRVRVDAFAGVASDGRPLDGLLFQPALAALNALQKGATERRALAAGRFTADMIVRTQIADAGRVADGVALTARPQLTGWVRMLTLPSCSRCVVLAGRVYSWSSGFARHPRCDCRHIPASEDAADDLRTDPRAYFDSLPEKEQDRLFTPVGAQAIRDGADLSQVVNARRGMAVAGVTRTRVRDDGLVVNERIRRQTGALVAGRTVFTTTEGTVRRRRGRVRLMPEQIYLEADGDRDEALRLLRLHGYLSLT